MNNQASANLGYLNLAFEQFYLDEYLKGRHNESDKKPQLEQQVTKRCRVKQEIDSFSMKRPRISENIEYNDSESFRHNLPNDLSHQGAELTEEASKNDLNQNSMDDFSNKTEFTLEQLNEELRNGEQLDELPQKPKSTSKSSKKHKKHKKHKKELKNSDKLTKNSNRSIKTAVKLTENADDSTDDDIAKYDNDPTKFWCICREPMNGRSMIQCFFCGEWFHTFKCMNMTEDELLYYEKSGEKWFCSDNCRNNYKNLQKFYNQ